MAIRSLKSQINYAITKNAHIGESKRSYRNQHDGKTNGRTFSVGYTEVLRDCANSFAKYIKAEHPDIRMAKEITTRVVQQWIDYNKDKWSNATTNNRISQMQVIAQQINNTYKEADIHLDELKNNKDQKRDDKIRDKAMDRKDYEAIRYNLQQSQSQARHAIEIAGRNGLRIKEISCLKTKNIDLEKNVLHITEGAKNGKYRDVPIRKMDRNYYLNLKKELENMKQEYVCGGVKEDSLNRAIRSEMKQLGLNRKYEKTTNHAIRKMYARERMEEERSNGKSEEKAWSIVQKELGHGSGFRQALYKTYIGK